MREFFIDCLAATFVIGSILLGLFPLACVVIILGFVWGYGTGRW